jgi:hypothetical protein
VFESKGNQSSNTLKVGHFMPHMETARFLNPEIVWQIAVTCSLVTDTAHFERAEKGAQHSKLVDALCHVLFTSELSW